MKKTDTCYYMSITKEENSAFVVANNQTIGAEPAQVIVETKTDSSSFGGMGSTTGTMGTIGGTTQTTISGGSVAGGNGTALYGGADAIKNVDTLYEPPRWQETCAGPRGQAFRAPMPPQVILQVPPSTPTPQLASSVRECRMCVCFS